MSWSRSAGVGFAFGDHNRNLITDVTNTIGNEYPGAAARPCWSRPVFDQPATRNAPDFVSDDILAGEDRDHARCGSRRLRRYGTYLRMRVRRTNDIRISLIGQHDVIDIAPPHR